MFLKHWLDSAGSVKWGWCGIWCVLGVRVGFDFTDCLT